MASGYDDIVELFRRNLPLLGQIFSHNGEFIRVFVVIDKPDNRVTRLENSKITSKKSPVSAFLA